MQYFHTFLALTLAASASASLLPRADEPTKATDAQWCDRKCTFEYYDTPEYKAASCDIKTDETCFCTNSVFVEMVAACLQTTCPQHVTKTREETIGECKNLKSEFVVDAFDAGVKAGKEAEKESTSSKSESASTATSSAPSSTADAKAEAATTSAAAAEEEEKKEDEGNAASRSSLGMMGVVVVAAVAGAFVV